MPEAFETMLAGGHPNSLGRTAEVVDLVLATPERFGELFACYGGHDAAVRLRTSNAMKRIESEQRDLLVPYVDRLIGEVGALDQASAQWTLAQLFGRLAADLSARQRLAAVELMKHNLEHHSDWIVLNATMETLSEWAKDDPALRLWLLPQLERLCRDQRKSVAGRAAKKLKVLATS